MRTRFFQSTDVAHCVQRLPYALAIIGLAIFALLFLTTGSVLIPVKALVMNAISLGGDLRRAYASGRRRQKQEPPVSLDSYQASPPFA